MFHDITVDDADAVFNIVNASGYKSCQLSFASLYCYAVKYSTQICVLDNFMFIKQVRPGFGTCYFMPVGDGDTAAALNSLMSYNDENYGGNLLLWGITDEMLDTFYKTVESVGKKVSFELVPDRDWAEYIHTPENLLNLKGKKFHSKKNAVNQFLRNNSDYSYESINSANLDEVMTFQQKYLRGVKKFEKDEGVVNDLDSENTAIVRGLENFEKIGLKGGVIRIDGDICAYAFGRAITDDTFDMTFEKALRNYNGIFQVLEQKMIVNDLSQFSFINREEDTGVEGLRFSKLKLRPDILMMKYSTSLAV